MTARLGQQCLHLSWFLLQICLTSPLLMTRYYQIFNKYQIFNRKKSANSSALLGRKKNKIVASERFLGAWSICSRAAWPDPAGEVRPAKVWRFYMERVAPKMVPRPVIIHICTLEDERRVHLRVYTVHPWKFGKSSEPNAPFSGEMLGKIFRGVSSIPPEKDRW